MRGSRNIAPWVARNLDREQHSAPRGSQYVGQEPWEDWDAPVPVPPVIHVHYERIPTVDWPRVALLAMSVFLVTLIICVIAGKVVLS